MPSLESHQPHLQWAQTEGTIYTLHELHLGTGTGSSSRVDVTLTPFTDPDTRRCLALEFTVRDQQLRIARDIEMRSQYLANRDMFRGLAHEIKNPLGGLRGAAQLLERESDNSDLHQFTNVIIREADRLQKLVDGMLGPRGEQECRWISLHEPIEHVCTLISTNLPESIVLRRDYDPSIPDILADREQLIQVVFNLATNAIEVLENTGEITIRTRTQRRFTIGGVQHRLVARIDIIDNGPGIPADLLPRIFHPLVTARADGTGMGLPIAQYLIQEHGGRIECDSRSGRTVFSVFFPLDTDL